MTDEDIDGIQQIREHIKGVGNRLILLGSELMGRATSHDASRFTVEEMNLSLSAIKDGDGLKFNSKEYYEWKDAYRKLNRMHEISNRHHPEHFDDGINGMDLIDLLEMLCDWCDKADDIDASIEINVKRFGISPQLFQILKNTVNNVKGLRKEESLC